MRMMNEKKINGHKQGYTLVELLAVLFFIGLMAGLAAPMIGGSRRGHARYSGSRGVTSLLRQARQLAVSRNAVYRVDFINATSVRLIDQQGVINQEGKTYILPRFVSFSGGTPADFQFERQGHVISGPVNIVINVMHTAKPGDLDVITVNTRTGQIDLKKF